MALKPVAENQATGNVKINYQRIKKVLSLNRVPLFFTYLGAFPQYLDYITEQLVTNLKNPQFDRLVNETNKIVLDVIKTNLKKPKNISQWLKRYRNSPSFFHFQRNLRKIFTINVKLSFVFIALREALKGWAIAAKKLPANQKTESSIDNLIKEEEFIFNDFLITGYEEQKTDDILKPGIDFSRMGKDLETNSSHSLEIDLLPEYLLLCRAEFLNFLKNDEFVFMRVGLEKIFLSSLSLFPNLLFSPINVVLKLTDNNSDFPELLYLLSEHFPTYAMQRMIFSGYMIEA